MALDLFFEGDIKCVEIVTIKKVLACAAYKEDER
jgi:hypothetical protein